MVIKHLFFFACNFCDHCLDVFSIYSQSAETTCNLDRDTCQYTNQSNRKSRNDSTQPSTRKRKKIVKKTSGLVKIPTSQPSGSTEISSSNRVTSTTSPTVAEQGKFKPWWKSFKDLKRSLQRFLTNIMKRILRVIEDITKNNPQESSEFSLAS